MHELAITRNIVAIVGEAARGRRVTRVTLEIGKLSGVMADAVAFCFDMVAAAELMLINKIDLLPHVDFSVERAVGHAREINPAIQALCLSARSGEGLAAWYDWLRREAKAARSVSAG
jgi:Zn finger protein HypA/HybF involved in hydrogenase expression